MNVIDTTRRASARIPILTLILGVGVVASGPLAVAQPSALPATPPTAARPGYVARPGASPAPYTALAAAPAAAQPADQPPRVVYSGGQLSIVADDSSLNQILRDVAQQTGMKITGGVVDQRVFGKYGPGTPARILTSLLEGSGSNMLLRESPTHTPLELVLTPSNGGPTPPSPTASGNGMARRNMLSEGRGAAGDRQPGGFREPLAARVQPNRGTLGASGFSPSNAPGAARPSTPNSTSGNNGNPRSPNGVATPQQIFQQLQQMRSQPNTR